MIVYALVLTKRLDVPPMRSPIEAGSFIGGKSIFAQEVACVSTDYDELVAIGKENQGLHDDAYIIDTWHIETVPLIDDVERITCEQCAHGQEVGIYTYCHEMREYVPRAGYCWKAVSK